MSLVNATDIKLKIEWDGTSLDEYFNAILPSVDALVDNAIGRPIQYASYTEYYNGDGSRRLSLRNGPIQTLTGVYLLSYGTGGSESASALTENVDFFVGGKASENWRLPGWLNSASEFAVGNRNYKVVYTAGYSDTTSGIPADIKQAALFAATWLWNKRHDAATMTRDVGDGGVSFRDEDELIRDLRTTYLYRYRSRRGG
jgi:hypothetical protein